LSLIFHAGKRITLLRNYALMSQDELAKELNISRSYLSNLEKGKNPLLNHIIKDVASFFKIHSDFFMNLTPNNEVQKYLDSLSESLLQNRMRDAQACVISLEIPLFNLIQDIEANFLKAAYYLRSHQYEKTYELEEEFIKVLLRDFEITAVPLSTQKAYYCYLIEKNIHLRHYSSCEKYCNRLIDLLSNQSEKQGPELTKVYLKMKQGNKALAFSQIQPMITTLESSNQHHLLAEGYSFLSSIHIDLKLYENALEHLEKLDLLATELELPNQRFIVAQQRGYIYRELKNYNQSLAFHKEALTLATTSSRKATVHLSIISNYIELNDLENAELHISFAHKYEVSTYEKMVLLSYSSQIALYKGDREKFQETHQKSLTFFIENNYAKNLHYVYSYLADFHLKQRKYKLAAEYYKKKENLNYEII